MGQSCQGKACCETHKNDNELPLQLTVSPKKTHLESKKSLFIVDEHQQLLATVFNIEMEGNIQEQVIEEEQEQEEQLPIISMNKIISQIPKKTSPKLKKRLRRVETLQDMRSDEEKEFFFFERFHAQAKEQENRDRFVDFYEYNKLYQKIIRFYQGHDLDSACQNITTLQNMEESIKNERKITQEEFDSKLSEIEEEILRDSNLPLVVLDRKLIAHIKALFADLNHYCTLAKSDPYQEKYKDDKIKISTRKDKGGMAVCIQAQLKSPFENFASFFNEIQYYPDFFPFCNKAYLIKNVGVNSKVGYVVLDLPVISKRDAFFQGLAYTRLNHTQEFIFYARSIHDKPHLLEQLGVEIAPNKKNVQMQFKFFVISYHPETKGQGQLKIFASFDYGISFIPSFVEEFAIKEFGKKMFESLTENNEKFKGSKWQKSVQQNPGVFNLMRDTVDQYLSKKTPTHDQQ